MTAADKPIVLLLAEDNSDDVLFFQRALKKAGISYPLHLARDGEETIDYLAGNGKFAERDRFPLPDILFLDINLPKKSGWEVLEWMQSRKELENIPVIIVSTSEHHQDLMRAEAFPLKAYVVKPVRPEQLMGFLSPKEI